MKIRAAASVYFFFQAFLVIAWWTMLFLYPGSRAPFRLDTASETSLMAFWLADISLIAFGSIAAAWLSLKDSELKGFAAWFVAGAVSYGALYCFVMAATTDTGWLGVVMMAAAMVWSGVFAVGITFEKQMFRPSTEASTAWILTKTFLQIVIVWTIILFVLPQIIVFIETKIRIPQFHFAFQKPLAIGLLILASIPGLWSAYVMSAVGRGTPLPLDHANELVVLGPYSYVRNPMALSGILQGLAVALYLGSPLVVIYAFFGSAIWQLIFRPLEELDLSQRFGGEYDHYRENVKCWISRFSRYKAES